MVEVGVETGQEDPAPTGVHTRLAGFISCTGLDGAFRSAEKSPLRIAVVRTVLVPKLTWCSRKPS